MTNDEGLDLLDALLERDPAVAPDRVLDAVLAALPHVPQRHRSTLLLRRSLTMPWYVRIGAGAAAIAVAVGLLLRPQSPADVGHQPSPPPPVTSESPAAALPVPGNGPIGPGRWSSDLFRPFLRFEVVADDWTVVATDVRMLWLRERGLERHLFFHQPASIIDPVTGGTEALPNDLAAWLRDHPWLDISGSAEETVGGRRAIRIDGRPRPDAPYDAGGIVELFGAQGQPTFRLASDEQFSILVVDLPDPLLIATVARQDAFGAFAEKARPVVGSVAFER